MALGAVYNCSVLQPSDVIESLLMLKQIEKDKDLKLVILLTTPKKQKDCKKLTKKIKKLLKIESIILLIPKGKVEREAFLFAIFSNLKKPNIHFLKDYLKMDDNNYNWKFLFFPKNLGLKKRKVKANHRVQNRRRFPSEVVGGILRFR